MAKSPRETLDVADVRRRLLDFFDGRRRQLPWRRNRDPYRVWVSEIMLQQTQVATVIPYYERWLRRFPDVAHLAEADEAAVLKAWEGLGYYTRARNLHRAARVVRERHRGRLPGDPEALRGLPGIGDYTAGAIASIAFGAAVPAVDANARRVLARLLDLPRPSPAALRAEAARLVDPDRPGDFNQAVMELGALVCTPRSPRCDACPLAVHCLARRRGTQALRPEPRRRPPVPTYDVGTAIIVAPDGRLLLRRRASRGLLAGLWEFPGDIAAEGESPEAAARRAAHDALARASGDGHGAITASADGHSARLPGTVPLAYVEHAYSHRRHRHHAFRFDIGSTPRPDTGSATPADLAWALPDRLADYALPAVQRKLAALLPDP
jgi:A/G-specific adenine glycosylase